MTKVSVSFVANLTDLPALFSTLGASLSLCEDLKVESIITVVSGPEKLAPSDLCNIGLENLTRDPGNLALGSTAPKTPGFTRERPAKKPGERINRRSEMDYTKSRVQTIMYNHMVNEGYGVHVEFETLKIAIELEGYSAKSVSPALSMLRKQGLVKSDRASAWAVKPAQFTGEDGPMLPLEGGSNG